VQDSEVIKDFGTVELDGDKTFSASVSFPVDDCPIISPTPEQCGDGTGSGGAPNSGGSSGGDSGGSGSSDWGSGSGSVGSSGSGVPDDIANGLRSVLPSTGGGMALWVLGAGLLLIAGGLLVRKVFR
jgi:LPXTG-motif cell wall-anchored protein